METFYLKGKDLINVFSAASTEDVPNIPFEINKILNNDLSSVKKQLQYLFQGPGNGIGKGMRLSVWCAEESPFNSQETIAIETNKYSEIKGRGHNSWVDCWNSDKLCKWLYSQSKD